MLKNRLKALRDFLELAAERLPVEGGTGGGRGGGRQPSFVKLLGKREQDQLGQALLELEAGRLDRERFDRVLEVLAQRAAARLRAGVGGRRGTGVESRPL
jgi:hypothetical protein